MAWSGVTGMQLLLETFCIGMNEMASDALSIKRLAHPTAEAGAIQQLVFAQALFRQKHYTKERT